jgi:tRNA pseudouridine55 synthase
VRIDALEVLAWASPLLTLRVACGKGTYVRSLAADIGAAVGCGASLDALSRTRLGPWTLEDAVPWATILAGDSATLGPRVLPADQVVAHLPAIRLDEGAAWRLASGQQLPLDAWPEAAGSPGLCRLYAGDRFLGIGEAGPLGVRPLRLVHADPPRTRSVSR